MGEKIVLGPYSKGLRNDVTPFNIDNDSFPNLINAYQWRGRVKRKRGTSLLGRLTRYFDSNSSAFNPGTHTQTLNGSGQGNLLTGFTSSGIQADAAIIPTSVTITAGVNTYTDPAGTGALSPSGSINYATGAITIAAEAGNAISASFKYYPDLPVMGLEELRLDPTDDSGMLAFDTVYSYNVSTSSPYTIHSVSFYWNPTTTSYPGYVAKTTWTPVKWNGQDYQQFWTTNYQNSLFATNGITFPFSKTHIGMQYRVIEGVTIDAAGPPALATLNIVAHGLVKGDFLFINEVGGITGINFQTGYVVSADPQNVDNVQVEFPYATLGGAYTSVGIAQYLTNSSDATKDCIRYYTGSPVSSASPPVFSNTGGWVNFCPPLSNLAYSINGLPAAQYYLVSARMIVPFKDRLLFIGPVIQTSAADSQIYLQDTIIYSQNGTPYYTASFTGTPSSVIAYTALLTPPVSSGASSFIGATPQSFWEDQTGLGGFISAGFQSDINTVSSNEDVLLLGFGDRQARFVYTGNDLIPFNFYVINSELGSGATFSAVNLDRGVISIGTRGVIISSQIESKRIDLDIPDQVFEIGLTSNGSARICSQRDFINEWIYFTYRSNASTTSVYKFPTQTLFYNYRDGSWALFNESYTTYGLFRRKTGFTWATIGSTYPMWSSWTDAWSAGVSTLLQPEVVGGNQQGFVLFRGEGTGEGNSLQIRNLSSLSASITAATQANPCVLTASNSFVAGQKVIITGVVGMTELNGNTYEVTSATPTTITINVNSTGFTAYVSGGLATASKNVYSPNHCLNNGDYIIISGCIGSISSINGGIFLVGQVEQNSFHIELNGASGTYLGGGVIKRMYVPFMQSKQFPVSWEYARKTRLGPQMYLLSTTANGQATLLIYLSQNGASAYNTGSIVPTTNPSPVNNSLVYSTVLYTCPESTNLGLSAPNINLQMVTGSEQAQIWHRMNTSLLGDTVQFAITLSDEQMTDIGFNQQFAELELHSAILDISPSQLLS